MQGSSSNKWIALAGVCALAAIGFAIWGFSQKSDLDKANDKVKDRDAQIMATQGTAAKTEAGDIRVARREAERYRVTRKGLIAADKQEADFRAEVRTQADQLAQARQELEAARTDEEKAAARAKVASEGSDVAVACAQATVDAIGEVMSPGADAGNPAGPAGVAMDKLESVAPDCREVLSGS